MKPWQWWARRFGIALALAGLVLIVFSLALGGIS